VNGIRFLVPLFYQEESMLGENQLSIRAYSAQIHRKHAIITVDFLPKTANPVPVPTAREDAESLGLIPMRHRNAILANRPGTCMEYAKSELVLAGYTAPQLVYIECRFGQDLDVRFDGSQDSASEFYYFIESAREANR
jgi:hypothetical protein